ncbi:MAG: hypothetical protein ABF888_08990 [Acetobacter papayae]
MHRTARVMGKGKIILPTVFLFLSTLSAGSALAATKEEQTKACKKDAMRLCTLYIPNERKITACMEKKFDQLSPGCQAMFTPDPDRKPKPSKKPKKQAG